MEEKKYELTDETIEVGGKILHRIKALKNFGDIEKGDLGGFIEKEDNLSHKGNCWIYGNACVYDDAHVYDDASVCGYSRVYGNACVYDNAHVYVNAWVYGEAHVCDNAYVCDSAHIYDNVHVCDDAWVCGEAHVYGNASVCGNANVYNNARVHGYARVGDKASVSDNAYVFGHAVISDKMHLSCNAYVKSLDGICYISSFGSENRYTTFFKCKDDTIKVNCGCFSGSLDEFRDKVKETHGDSKYAKEYLMAIELVKIKFNE